MAQWWRWWSWWFSLCFGDDDDTLQHLAVRSQYRDQALGGWAPSGICRHFSKVETRFTCGPLVIFVITRNPWKLSERHTLEQWAKHLYHNWKQNNFLLPWNLLQRLQAKIAGMWQRIDNSQRYGGGCGRLNFEEVVKTRHGRCHCCTAIGFTC